MQCSPLQYFRCYYGNGMHMRTPYVCRLKVYNCVSLVPRPLPVFQRATLKNWVGPGYEATTV